MLKSYTTLIITHVHTFVFSLNLFNSNHCTKEVCILIMLPHFNAILG